MKYRFYGDELQLIRYEIEVTETELVPNPETDELEDQEVTHIYCAVSDNEKNALLKRYPNAIVTEVDNVGYEWLDGMTFTNEQRLSGEVEKAIEMGEAAYTEYLYASDQNAQMLELDYRLSLVELGVGGEML